MDAVLQTDEEKNTKVGFMRLLNMNKKEWPYIITGMLSAAGQGTIMPLFAVILSSLIAALMPGVPSSRILRFSILFWCLGAAQFVLSSVQVCKRRPHPHANVGPGSRLLATLPLALSCCDCGAVHQVAADSAMCHSPTLRSWPMMLLQYVPTAYKGTVRAGFLLWAGGFQPRIARAGALPEGSAAPGNWLVRSGRQHIWRPHIPAVNRCTGRARCGRRCHGRRGTEHLDAGVWLRHRVHKWLEDDTRCDCRTTFARVLVLHADEVLHRYATTYCFGLS